MIEVNYPDCTNYEGRKILIFKGCSYHDIVAQKELDPHFSDSKKLSPFMRIEPTEKGWAAGKLIIQWLSMMAMPAFR